MRIIELLGLSRSGKTTLTRKLVKSLRSEGYKTAVFERPDIDFRRLGDMAKFHELYFKSMERGYQQALSDQMDLLVYDRGFIDRKIMLALDTQEGTIDSDFSASLFKKLKRQIELTDYAFLLSVHPKVSISRIDSQRSQGLDNSHLCTGMNTREDPEELTRLIHEYNRIKDENPRIIVINGEAPKGKVYKKVRSVIKRKLNGDKKKQRCTK